MVTGSNSAVPNGDIAIDAKELGGMYANRIRIISTDKGAGVNSDAFIVSVFDALLNRLVLLGAPVQAFGEALLEIRLGRGQKQRRGSR